jgi:predicted ATP-dependent serine protease
MSGLSTYRGPCVCTVCRRVYPHYVSSCGPPCLAVGKIVPLVARAGASTDGIAEVASAADLARLAMDEIRADAYPTLRLGRGAFVLVSGPEGSGKTTFAARTLDSVGGPVTLVSGEMGLGPALAAMLQRLAIRRQDYLCVGRCSVAWLHDQLRRSKSVAVAFDSAQSLGLEPADVRHLLATTSLRLAVVISQLNRAGDPAGRRELAHECDVHVEVSGGRWSLAKSRYQRIQEAEGLVMKEETHAA